MGKLKKRDKKRGLFLVSLIIGMFLLNFVQAYMGSFGYFGNFSSEDVFLAAVFVVIFFVINLAFSRFFRDSQGRSLKTAWIPALALSIGATYGLWKTGFNLGDFLFDIGIPSGFLDILAPILVIGFLIFLIHKWGFSRFLFLLAGLFFFVGITKLVYEWGWSIFIGVILFGIGLIVHYRGRGWGRGPSPRKPFSRKTPVDKEDKQTLIREAKRFKKRAKKSGNPKFYGSWARFVNYMKRRGYGRSEDEITANLGLNRKKFVKIFNKYGRP